MYLFHSVTSLIKEVATIIISISIKKKQKSRDVKLKLPGNCWSQNLNSFLLDP